MTGGIPDGMTEPEARAIRVFAKEQLRRRLSGLRRATPAAVRKARSEAACARILDAPTFRAAEVVLGYFPLRFEVDIRPLLDRAHQLKKQVVLPRVVPGTPSLSLHLYEQGDGLHESGFMVSEPSADAPEVAAELIDLALVPGLGFDVEGRRLGFGKGYYDRMLPRLTRAHTVGVAFDFALLAELPAEAHDVAVQAVATDARFLDIRGHAV